MVAVDIFDPLNFVTVIVLAFAIVLFLAGIFTAYFGNGKSRKAGILMLICGIAIGVVWAVLSGSGTNPPLNVNLLDVFLSALGTMIAVLIGAIVALAIFLIAVMKS